MKSRPNARSVRSTLTRERQRVRQLMEAHELIAAPDTLAWRVLPNPTPLPDNVIPFPSASKQSDVR